jgi:DNA topoisomerase-1
VVNDLLVKHFSGIVDIEFTVRMEKELDEIANENRDWVGVVRDFYAPFEKSLADASEVMERVKLADELVEETCPKCEKPLAIKTGRYGKFLACSGYPECKFTKPYQIKLGVNCPECGSELIERLSKKRRIFYGCSNYPNCRFASNFRPLPDPCPNCGGLLTLYRGKQAKCTKCSYRGKIEQD